MYFIGSGTVAIYSAGKEVAHLSDGAHFGEVVLVTDNNRRSATVVAIETCELYTLDRHDFIQAIAPYPDVMKRIRRDAFERLNIHTDRTDIEITPSVEEAVAEKTRMRYSDDNEHPDEFDDNISSLI